jgi:hypothetical protein
LPVTVAEKAVVADSLKALRQDMKQKPADELVSGKLHRLRPAVITVVFPEETHTAVFDVEQTVVGDGDAVSIAADVKQNLFGSGKGRLGIDDPFVFLTGFQ